MLKPFSEKVLNFASPLSELCIVLIFAISAVNLMEIPENFHGTIDEILVSLINAIMAIQMLSSILILIKTIREIIKKRCSRTAIVSIGPIDPTAKNLEIKPTE